MPDGTYYGMRLAKIARATRSSLKLHKFPANRRRARRLTRRTRFADSQLNGANNLPWRVIALNGGGVMITGREGSRRFNTCKISCSEHRFLR